MKWSPANDKKSLASVQQTLVLFSKTLKTIPGVKSVQRVVCGGCMDFKVIVVSDEKGRERTVSSAHGADDCLHNDDEAATLPRI